MEEKDIKMEDTIRQTFLNEFGGIIKGLTTPQEMADYVLEYVVEKLGMINLDYQDALTTMRGVKEGDGLVIQTDKVNILSALKDCETKLKNAHPSMTLKKLLLQIIVPQQSTLTMDDMQMFNDFFNSLDENLQTAWGIGSSKDDNDKYQLFIMVGYND